MATRKIGNDLPGSFFNRGHNDARRDRAVRRLMFHHDGDKQALLDFITLGSAAESFKVAPGQADDGIFLARTQGNDDDQGNPTFTGGELVHPEDTALPLQTTKVTKVGRDRWSATLTYFRLPTTEPGGPGSGVENNAGSLIKLRIEYQPTRVYTDGQPDGTYSYMSQYGLPTGEMLVDTYRPCAEGPVTETEAVPHLNRDTQIGAYSRIEVLPIIKILIPFATPLLPFNNVGLIGCLNDGPVKFGGFNQENLLLGPGECRFDGVQMEELGSFVNANGQSARFFGSYMFTGTPTKFYTQVPKFCDGRWTVELVQSNVNTSTTWTDINDIGL